jgi:hypothetical protein
MTIADDYYMGFVSITSGESFINMNEWTLSSQWEKWLYYSQISHNNDTIILTKEGDVIITFPAGSDLPNLDQLIVLIQQYNSLRISPVILEI